MSARCHVCLTILDPDGSCKECKANPKLRAGHYCEECSGPLAGTGRVRYCSNSCMRKSQNRRYYEKRAAESGERDPLVRLSALREIILACEPTAGPAVHDIIRAIEEGVT